MVRWNWVTHTNIRNVKTKRNILLVLHMDYQDSFVYVGWKKE